MRFPVYLSLGPLRLHPHTKRTVSGTVWYRIQRAVRGAKYRMMSAIHGLFPGSIRGDLALAMPDNLVHGSDSPESAARELALWFG